MLLCSFVVCMYMHTYVHLHTHTHTHMASFMLSGCHVYVFMCVFMCGFFVVHNEYVCATYTTHVYIHDVYIIAIYARVYVCTCEWVSEWVFAFPRICTRMRFHICVYIHYISNWYTYFNVSYIYLSVKWSRFWFCTETWSRFYESNFIYSSLKGYHTYVPLYVHMHILYF